MPDQEEVVHEEDTGLEDLSPEETADPVEEQPEVVSDDPPSVEDSTEEEPAPEQTEEPAAEEAAEEETAEPDVPTIKIGNEEYKANEIPPEVLEKMATHYGQVGHYQKMYEETKGQLEQFVQQQPRQQQAAPEPVTADTYKKAYGQTIKNLRDQGFIGDFIAEEDPALVASMVHQVGLLDQARQVIAYQEQRLRALEERDGVRHNTEVSTSIERVFDEIADEDEFYAPLKDKETRRRLFESVGSMFEGAPNQAQLEQTYIDNILKDPKNNLKKLYYMFAGSDMQEQFKKGRSKATSNAKKRAARTAGEVSTSATAPAPRKAPVPDDGLDDLAPE